MKVAEPEIKRVDTKIVYKNRWMSVREDRVRRPNGDHGLFAVVDKPDTCLVIPKQDEQYFLVQRYHYPVNGHFWQFPQGLNNIRSDESPERVALAELATEAGLIATKVSKIAQLHQAYSFSTNAIHLFLAEGAEVKDMAESSNHQAWEVKPFTAEDINQMIKSGDITDMATISAWSFVS